METSSLAWKSDYIKVGPWTVDEDRRLTDYIQSHAGSSWLDVPQAAGLLRSVKSCCLRWLNHLNPATERRILTETEEDVAVKLLIELHQRFWYIAACLPEKAFDDAMHFLSNYTDNIVPSECEWIGEKVKETQKNTREGSCNDQEPFTLKQLLYYIGDILADNLDATQNKRDVTFIEQNDLHSKNKGVVQVDSSENNDTTPNDSDYDDDDQNNNKTSLDTTHISKTPGYITSKICISLEVLEQLFDMNMEDAAKSLNAQILTDNDATQHERDATCIEQNDTNVGQPYSITIPPTPQDDLHSENKGVVQVEDSLIYGPDQDLRDAQILNDEDETQNERDATCIEQNDTNVGQPYSITIPPTPQDDLHSENKDVVQVDSSENNDTAPNDSDYDDDDQNNNKTSLDTTHISKTPDYITSKISFSLEVLEQHFDMNMEDAAKSLNVSRSSLKRMCRANGINRWPCRKRKINHQQLDNPKTVNKLVQKNNNQMNQSTRTQAEIISPSGNASSTNSNVIIKATYRDDIIKFRLSVSSGVDELRGKIGKRLELEVRSFKLKYRDDAGDLVLINCDEDLHDCLGYSRSLSRSIDHKTTFDFLVFPVINNSG